MTHDQVANGPDGLFRLTTFLEGHTRAWGIFQDRFGRVRRRFDVTMVGRWQGSVFVLDETFAYDDGRTEHRTWNVRAEGTDRFRAVCDDCVGEAIGLCSQDSIQMTYAFKLKLPSRTLVVDFDDRLYRVTPTTAVNRATMRKWGVKLGELVLFFERRDEAAIRAGQRAA